MLSVIPGEANFDPENTSWSVVERARGGDESAWRQLISWINPLLLHWCRKAGLQDADAFDICQDVAHAVSRHLNLFQKTQSSFRAWIKVITNNKINDHLRRLRRQPTAVGGSDAEEGLRLSATDSLEENAATAAEEEGILFQRALTLLQQEFAETTWRAFWGVVVDGRRAADVAAELGMTTNAVYLARGRIMGRLRREFNSELSTSHIDQNP